MPLFNLIVFPPMCIRTLRVEVCPSHTTSAEPISAARAAVEAPYLGATPASARVQNRVEFVKLARDMSSNCTRSHWDYRLLRWTARGTRGTTIVSIINTSYHKLPLATSTGYQGTTCVCYVLVSFMYVYSRMNMNISCRCSS